jgi:hypothetical protein
LQVNAVKRIKKEGMVNCVTTKSVTVQRYLQIIPIAEIIIQSYIITVAICPANENFIHRQPATANGRME